MVADLKFVGLGSDKALLQTTQPFVTERMTLRPPIMQ